MKAKGGNYRILATYGIIKFCGNKTYKMIKNVILKTVLIC